MNRRTKLVISSVFVMGGLAFAQPALADAPQSSSGSSATTDAASGAAVLSAESHSFTDQSCVQQVKAAFAASGSTPAASDLAVCTISITAPTTSDKVVTAADRNDLSSLSTADAAAIDAAAASSKVHRIAWGQDMCSGGLVNTWCEYHSAVTYYNGSKAWTTHSYKGYKGRHTCDSSGSFGIGWQIDVASCDDDPDGSSDLVGETFKVSFAIKGSPITVSEQMGRIWKKNGTWTWTTSY